METKDFNIKAEGEGKYTLTAYAATFHREPDSYGDIISKGAFSRSLGELKAEGRTIPLLFDHRMDDPFMNIGIVREAVEDDTGLLITAQFDMDNDRAAYVRKLVMEGRLSKMSFAYSVRDAKDEKVDGQWVRNIKDVDIYEVSVVTVPANKHADILDAKNTEPETSEEKAEPTEEDKKEVIRELLETEVLADDIEDDSEIVRSDDEATAAAKEPIELTDEQKSLLAEIKNYTTIEE